MTKKCHIDTKCMEFSSSSDDELRQIMVEGFKKEQQRTRCAERFSGSVLVDLLDGTFMEKRRGCIYLKSRGKYIHVSEGRRTPEKYFGDPTKKVYQRRVNAKQVHLLKVSLEETVNRWERVVLADADECESFLFQVLEEDNVRDSEEETREITLNKYSIIDRLEFLESYRLSPSTINPKKVVHLSDGKCDDSYTVASPLNLLIRYSGRESFLAYSSLNMNEIGESFSPLSEVRLSVATQPQRSIGVQLLYPSVTCTSFNRIVYLGTKYLGIATISLDNQDDLLELNTFTETSLPSSMEHWIWCMSKEGLYRRSVIPYVSLASGRQVYEYFINDSGEWSHNTLCCFRKTFVTSMELYSRCEGVRPELILCGMRNGSIQMCPTNVKLKEKYDNILRHRDSAITGLHQHYSKPYEIISCSNSGSIKLWDIRFLSTLRDPILEIRKEDCRQQVMGSLTCSFSGLLAIKSASTLELYRTDPSVSLLNKVATSDELERLEITVISGHYYILYGQVSQMSFLRLGI